MPGSPSVSAMTWKVPGYVVEELLGFGGSGEVWRGHVSSTGDPVALKRLPIGDAAQVQAARAEAALLSTLDHPHLIRLHELVPVADAVVLVLDLAAGGSLADLLAQRGRLTPGEVITALAPIGAALAYAHNEGVVHGDVSPANVLFSAPGLPLLADLGVARIVGDCAPARSTPAYVDPAVAAGCAPGAPSDVFMLAAVALHALTGTPIWRGNTPDDMLAQAASGDIGDLHERLTGVPDDLAAVLERALAVEPHLRCNAAEFALDLRHSGEPIPVELAAGRSRESHPAVHSADPADARPADSDLDDAHPSEGLADLARPMFSRPEFNAAAPASSGQLTHGVRAALRPAVPDRRRRRHSLRAYGFWRRRRVACAIALVVATAVVAGGGVVWSRHRTDAAPRPAPGSSRPATHAPGSHTRSAPPDAPRDVDTQAAAVLRSLDDVRERAFAARDASLLTRVYRAGTLLAQDVALLERIVPRGCGLIGVHTAYSSVHASAARGRLILTARATLAASTLTCGASTSGTAAGEGPTVLRIELAPQADGYRIVSQQKLT